MTQKRITRKEHNEMLEMRNACDKIVELAQAPQDERFHIYEGLARMGQLGVECLEPQEILAGVWHIKNPFYWYTPEARAAQHAYANLAVELVHFVAALRRPIGA